MHSLKAVFDMLVKGPSRKNYVFVNGHPVDRRNKKYKLYYRWYEEGKLHCFGCGVPAHHFTMKACKSAGCFHSSGKRKHSFSLFSENGVPFTLDHWYPKSWLKSVGLRNSITNLVPMCYTCNHSKKQDALPIIGRWGKSFHMPVLLDGYAG